MAIALFLTLATAFAALALMPSVRAAAGTRALTAARAVASAVPAPQHYVPRPVAAGTSRYITVPSPDALGGRRTVWVYRPAAPDSAQLPVLYFLHGLPGSAADVAGTGIASYLDTAFRSGALSPFVVVAPDGNTPGASDPEWADSIRGHVRLETFVTRTLIHAVEGTHLRDARHRAIAGFSMGGFGAMNLALRHPDLYGQVASISGYFHVDDPSGVFGHSRLLRAANSPDQHTGSLGPLRVFLASGRQDDESVVAGEARRFAALLTNHGDPVELDQPPGTHSWAFVRAELPKVVDFLEQGWLTPLAWSHPDR